MTYIHSTYIQTRFGITEKDDEGAEEATRKSRHRSHFSENQKPVGSLKDRILSGRSPHGKTIPFTKEECRQLGIDYYSQDGVNEKRPNFSSLNIMV
jgi:hypothetical protein